MILIDEYLFYIQEEPEDPPVNSPKPDDDPALTDKKERFKELRKQYRVKSKKCKAQEEPAKTNCLNGLMGLGAEIKSIAKEISPTAATVGAGLGKAASFAKKHSDLAKYAAGAAAVSLAIAGSIKVYNRFFSQAAKACANKPDKTECMKDYKIQALQKAKSEVSRGKSKCAQTKNPEKCVTKMDRQIQKYNKKMLTLKR